MAHRVGVIKTEGGGELGGATPLKKMARVRREEVLPGVNEWREKEGEGKIRKGKRGGREQIKQLVKGNNTEHWADSHEK